MWTRQGTSTYLRGEPVPHIRDVQAATLRERPGRMFLDHHITTATCLSAIRFSGLREALIKAAAPSRLRACKSSLSASALSSLMHFPRLLKLYSRNGFTTILDRVLRYSAAISITMITVMLYLGASNQTLSRVRFYMRGYHEACACTLKSLLLLVLQSA